MLVSHFSKAWKSKPLLNLTLFNALTCISSPSATDHGIDATLTSIHSYLQKQ